MSERASSSTWRFPSLPSLESWACLCCVPSHNILPSCSIPVLSPALKAAESSQKAVRVTLGKCSLHRAANELVEIQMPTRVSASPLSVQLAVNQHNIHPNPGPGLQIPPLHMLEVWGVWQQLPASSRTQFGEAHNG